MRFILVVLWVHLSIFLFGQVGQTNVLPGLQGAPLVQALREAYKTKIVLDYSIARDTLFSKIDAQGDSLECIYTGMKKFLTPGSDPTEAVFMGGLPNGINTEHSWPQSKGATGLAFSDMHHLFPSRVKTNADRGDFIMGEIPDNETKIWYYKTTERSGAPPAMRDLYSELVQGKFEPRESVKGNIARALFYFYTMYKEQADTEDPEYFTKMKADLCEWHYLDPVDSMELIRNKKIAFYQGGKENPFIIDCSLVSRAYCNNIDQACEAALLSGIEINHTDNVPSLTTYPNPVSNQLTIEVLGLKGRTIRLKAMNASGAEVLNLVIDTENDYVKYVWDTSGITAGMYCIQVTDFFSIRPVVQRILVMH